MEKIDIPLKVGKPDYDKLIQESCDSLIKMCSYLSPEDQAVVAYACNYARIAHDGQTRKSGEPYITHPIAVATKVASWRFDYKTIVAALLHDVLEDCEVSKEDMASKFGSDITEVVDGLSKLDKLEFKNYEEHHAESFRKLILAMSKDLRVVVVKIADRWHNMRTLGSMRPEKCRRIAKETLEIHAQLANRIGMNSVYHELQDMGFRYLYPYRYKILSCALESWRKARGGMVKAVLNDMTTQLVKFNIEAKIKGREKNLYGIYEKMRRKHLHFSQVMDLYSFRIIVNSISDCYLALGALHNHEQYKPQPGRFKDFIAIPKKNGYQSLHTTLVNSHSVPIAVQIRTQSMDELAETGLAKYWVCEQDSDTIYSHIAREKLYLWIQNIKRIHEDSDNAIEFSENIKVDLFPRESYVFTPKGEIITLPKGSTPIDFAYAISTKLGHRCNGALVNGKVMPLSKRLHTGDKVEILTQDIENPRIEWLKFVVSAAAKSAIRNYRQNVSREDAITLGRDLVSKTCTILLPQEIILSDEIRQKYEAELDKQHLTFQDVLYNVGMGQVLPIHVALHLARLAGETKKLKISNIHDVSDILLFATCCNPIPGDEISAVFDKTLGLIVHRDNCHVLLQTPIEEHILINWEWESAKASNSFQARIAVEAQDGHGLLAILASTISSLGSDIVGVESSESTNQDELFECLFNITIQDLDQLNKIIQALHSIPQVQYIKRV